MARYDCCQLQPKEKKWVLSSELGWPMPGAEAHRSWVQGLKELAQADGEPMSTLPSTHCCPAPFTQLGTGSPGLPGL